MIDHGYQTRTWDELKAETLARAERGAYPVFAITPEDAREALSMIHDLDPDAWGGAWMAVGDRHMERAQQAEASDASAAARALSLCLAALHARPLAGDVVAEASGRAMTRRRPRSRPMAGW